MQRLRGILRRWWHGRSDLFPSDELGRSPFADMKRFVPTSASPLILDVGGHTGGSVCRFKETFPASVIHSFEPSPERFQELKRRTSSEAGVFLWNRALGGAAGKKTLLENESSGMSSFFPLGEFGWGRIEKESIVDVMTLDSFLAGQGIERVDILKSDTQGHELEILKGAENVLRNNRIGLIYLELIFSPMYEGLPPLHEIFRHLAERNFSIVSIYEMQHQRNLADWADALFVNREYHGKVARS